MKIAMLIEMPAGTLLDELAGEVQLEVVALGTLFPPFSAPGTEVLDPKKVLYCVIDSEAEDPRFMVDGMIFAFDLGWTVLGMQSLYAIEPIIETIEDEEVVAGHQAKKYMELAPSIWNYIPDRLDGNEQPLTKDPSWLTTYAGTAPWL